HVSNSWCPVLSKAWLSFRQSSPESVNHVPAHLSPMSPVHTAKQKESDLPPGNPRLAREGQKYQPT
ncbi:MAG: hypothetical protein Q7T87_10045, partial [Polaromonas sp.]|nr:hypothetical protein [Polaromonas sp.]